MPLRYLIALYDTTAACLSFVISMYLRLGSDFFSEALISGAIIFTCVATICLVFFRIYRRMWRYISIPDLTDLIKAVTLSVLIFLPAMFLYNRLEGMPRSVVAINWFVLIFLLGVPRFLYRMIKERTLTVAPVMKKIPILLVGINDHTELFIRETSRNEHSPYKIVGIIDDDKKKNGSYIRNVKIYSDISTIEKVIEKLRKKDTVPQKIVISPNIIDGTVVKNLLDIAEKQGLTVARLPRVTAFKEEGTLPDVRPIALEDLLGRPQTALDKSGMKLLIKDKRVLITGAGGTIGSELVRQIAKFSPSQICLVEISEHNLYLIDKELDEKFPEILKVPLIGDIRNRDNLDMIFAENKPEIVFHAAALKHVPMSEVNISEAIITNILGTKNVADACINAKVKEMVMISTDKAVNPTNVMGATKRAAESYVQAISQEKKTTTSFVTIRFGNVLGSTGSVVPLFKRQIAEGKPVTVTHPEITRYFMTVREAVELVLHTATFISNDNLSSPPPLEGGGGGGVLPSKTNGIFVLDMGEPVLIKDLAEQLIRLAGLTPDVDIKIEYTGLRKGEKLFEELFHESETLLKTDCDKIFLANPREISIKILNKLFKKIHEASMKRDSEKAICILKEIVPEYVST